MQASPRSNKSFDGSSNESSENPSRSTPERYKKRRDEYYGRFQVHDEQFASSMKELGLTAKLLGSLGRKERE
jgi:hypothetical protein